MSAPANSDDLRLRHRAIIVSVCGRTSFKFLSFFFFQFLALIVFFKAFLRYHIIKRSNLHNKIVICSYEINYIVDNIRCKFNLKYFFFHFLYTARRDLIDVTSYIDKIKVNRTVIRICKIFTSSLLFIHNLLLEF